MVALLNLISVYKYYDQPADVFHLNYQLHLKLELKKKNVYILNIIQMLLKWQSKYIQSQDILGTIISKFICNFLFRDVSTKSSSVGVLSRYSTKFDTIKKTMVRKQTKETIKKKKKTLSNYWFVYINLSQV